MENCPFEDTGACLVVAKVCKSCSYGKLVIAYREGRLIVLPCKVGESYYGICQEVHHIKGKWKLNDGLKQAKYLNFILLLNYQPRKLKLSNIKEILTNTQNIGLREKTQRIGPKKH